MQLPNADVADVSRKKIVEYLLNPRHPDGAGKAAFFLAAGFRVESWQDLANALRSLAASAPILRRVDSRHGSKYIVDGPIEAPIGRMAAIRSVWIIDAGNRSPRWVTAYPLRQES
jgi:Domain of unknown function (DUF6883)